MNPADKIWLFVASTIISSAFAAVAFGAGDHSTIARIVSGITAAAFVLTVVGLVKR